MMINKKEVALYVRVSTKDKQEEQNQIDDLTEYCRKSDWVIKKIYIDKISGGVSNREQFQKMFLEAHQKKFDIVFFWALDRFSREGIYETLNYLNKLEKANVGYKSYNEPIIDSEGPFKEIIIAFLALMAKQERTKISDRVKSGMRRAKKDGKRISRPPLKNKQIEKIRQLT